jgi:actin-like ATPase involved in cell morphogenesis
MMQGSATPTGGYTLAVDIAHGRTTAAVGRIGQPPHVQLLESGSSHIPTALWLGDTGVPIVGSAAMRRGATDSTRLATGFMRIWGSSATVLLGGAAFTGAQLVTRLLSTVVTAVSDEWGAAPTLVAVTHPQRWNEAQRASFTEAVARAVDVPVELIGNAAAAAVEYFALVTTPIGSTVATVVLDAGGLDVGVFANTGAGVETVAVGGTGQLGGEELDAAVFAATCSRLGINGHDDGPDWVAALDRLRSDCRAAVHQLTTDDSVAIEAWLPIGRRQLAITRHELLALASPMVDDWAVVVQRVLQQARGRGVVVSNAVVVGDHGRVPGFIEALSAAGAVAVDLRLRPATAVALGACRARSAHRAATPASRAAGAAFAPPQAPAAMQPPPPPAPHVPAPPAPSTPATPVPSPPLPATQVERRRAPEPVAAPSKPADADLVGLIDTVITIAHEEQREDLAGRLTEHRDGLANTNVRLLVVGDFKQGKSTLVNALVGHPVCPMDADFATAVPTVVRNGAPAAAIRQADATSENGVGVAQPIALADVGRWVNERAGADVDRDAVVSCEITMPVEWMSDGIELVDMPGFGGADTGSGARILADLNSASALLFVSDSSQELTAPEIEFLRLAQQRCPTIAVVLTKTDCYIDWRLIRDIDRRHLHNAGSTATILPVSALRGTGIAELIEFLQTELLSQALAARTVQTTTELSYAGAHLLSVMHSELDSFDPGRQARVAEDARRTLSEIAQMRLDSAPWHRLLTDRRDDLQVSTADRLDTELRELSAAAGQAIAAHDPAVVWNEFQNWLRDSTTMLVTDTYVQLTEEATSIEQQLISQLAAVQGVGALTGQANDLFLRSLRLDMPSMRSEGSASDTAIAGSWSAAEPLIGLGGFLPGFGPVSLAVAAVAGLAFGRRALRVRRESALDARRAQARAFVEEYLHDVQRLAAKPIERYINQVYRTLRDGVLRRAEELERSATEALAKSAGVENESTADRAARRAQLTAEIQQLDEIMRHVEGLSRKVMS